MPYLKIETSKKLSDEQKQKLCLDLLDAFSRSSSKEVSKNIQIIIYDKLWINFRGEVKDSAHVQLSPGPLTPYEDYPMITREFFKVLVNDLNIPADSIYINIIEFQYWGFNGQFITIDKHA